MKKISETYSAGVSRNFFPGDPTVAGQHQFELIHWNGLPHMPNTYVRHPSISVGFY